MILRYVPSLPPPSLDIYANMIVFPVKSPPSNQIEKTLTTLAPHHPTTRFVKLHHEIAEMNHIQPPALLAYRGAEVFATLVDVLDVVERRRGNGRSMSEALGDLLREYVLFPSLSSLFGWMWDANVDYYLDIACFD